MDFSAGSCDPAVGFREATGARDASSNNPDDLRLSAFDNLHASGAVRLPIGNRVLAPTRPSGGNPNAERRSNGPERRIRCLLRPQASLRRRSLCVRNNFALSR